MPEPASERRLQRSPERIVGGVCGGLAAHFGVAPRTLRWGYAALTVVGFVLPGVLVYLILWLALPAADADPGGPRAGRRESW